MKSILRDAKALETMARRGGQTLDAQIHGVANKIAMSKRLERLTFTTGIGKSAQVASRFATSLRSLSIPSSFIHASEWGHGDLGGIYPKDVFVIFSHSGTTKECVQACQFLSTKVPRSQLIAIHEKRERVIGVGGMHVGDFCESSLAYELGDEDSVAGRCPTRSLVAQHSIVNALLDLLIHELSVSPDAFKANHPQ